MRGTFILVLGLVVTTATAPLSTAATASRGLEPAESRLAAAVTTETQLRAAWADPRRRRIDLGADIVLRDCAVGDPIRESPYPLLLNGNGHTIRQTCFEKRLLRQDGTGYLEIHDLTLTRGGSDGPGAALTSRGEITLYDCVIKQNLAEEPGGGVFSMRRVTVHRSRINGNLANDDGGGIYARRGGVQVYDSVLSNNLVDGSGGAIGSTGDILVVRSRVDGNTTDGDGGALYADEDGDVTVIESLIDGSDADGPGGGIFTLDGDVAVLGSTLLGNRADDRGGAISGEADVLLVNSTVARNLAVAHAGGGIWARGNLVLVNTTVTNNYSEGEGGGLLSAGRTTLIGSTLTRNFASVGGDLGAAGTMSAFASIVGPPAFEGVTGDTIPTRRSCRVYATLSQGYNLVSDDSCELDHDLDITGLDPLLALLEDDPEGFVLLPLPESPVRGRIPSGSCRGVLPDPLPAGQLLAPYVDWDEILTHDAIGRVRDTGAPCDIGAVQTVPPAGRAPAAGRYTDPPQVPDADGPTPPPSQSRPVDRPRVSESLPRPTGDLPGLARQVDALAASLRGLSTKVGRFARLEECISPVAVDRVGDPRHRWGYLYDERDGTGTDLRPALAPHRGRARPDLLLLQLSTGPGCLSAAPDPNGSGEDARVVASRSGRVTVRGLLRRLRGLERIETRIERAADRFDEWESCVSWLPVTEDGDLDQDLGYVADVGSVPLRRRVPAIDIDTSERDDPDYQLLAFEGRNRPFQNRECGTEPGESADRPVRPRPAPGAGLIRRIGPLQELRSGIRSLREDVEDLGEPVAEVTRFDECMFTVGVRARSNYVLQGPNGSRAHRPAYAFDMRGHRLPQRSVLAFPGEEPPQIECNEDAGGFDDDE